MNSKKFSIFTRQLLIKAEKRRRAHIYGLMDYSFNLSTFMDFYSKDLIGILGNAHLWAKIITDEFFIESEDVLCAFLLSNHKIENSLRKHNFNEKSLAQLLDVPIVQGKINLFKLKKYLLYTVKKAKFSPELIEIFEESLINAMERFGTPIVTPEIFFITLMESKKSEASEIIKKVISKEINWYLLRYRLLKKLHYEEIHLRFNSPKGQLFFAYLLKSRISQIELLRLINLDLLRLSIKVFRTRIFKKIIRMNFFKKIKKSIIYSSIFHQRKYKI